MSCLQITHHTHFTVLTLNRPHALNALNNEVFTALDEVLSNPLPETSRLLLITGTGEKAFAAGADITEFSELSGPEAEALSRRGQIIFEKLSSSSIPTVALINGYALGGGLELALACQIRLVTRTAQLGLPELNLGLIPGYGGTQRLASLMGKGKAIYYTLTSENIKAETALASGLADFLVEDVSEGFTFVEKFASRLAGKSRVASQLAMEAILASGSEGGMEFEAANFRRAFETEDMKEGVTAFLEKRKPEFKNR